MGNSAQEHRVVTGLFAGRMSSANWTHSTGSYKAYKRKRKLDADPRFCWSLIMLLLVIIVTTVQLWHLMLSPSLSLHTSLQSVTYDSDVLENPVSERTAGQIKVLLLLSGNIERKLGPCTGSDISDPLIGGLAQLVGQAMR